MTHDFSLCCPIWVYRLLVSGSLAEPLVATKSFMEINRMTISEKSK